MENAPTPAPAAKFNIFPFMVKLDRIAAFVLFLAIIAYGVTGYGMTKGLISQDIARSLHLSYLGIIALIAFVIHTYWALHLALKRKGVWNKYSKFGLAAFYVILASFFLYLQFFYGGTESERRERLSDRIGTTSSQTSVASSTTVFTAATLKQYDGQNGQPAYVAVDGVVYDMSAEFRNGDHHGYSAGQDLSAAFHGQHPDSYLNGLTIVGTYKN